MLPFDNNEFLALTSRVRYCSVRKKETKQCQCYDMTNANAQSSQPDNIETVTLHFPPPLAKEYELK